SRFAGVGEAPAERGPAGEILSAKREGSLPACAFGLLDRTPFRPSYPAARARNGTDFRLFAGFPTRAVLLFCARWVALCGLCCGAGCAGFNMAPRRVSEVLRRGVIASRFQAKRSLKVVTKHP